MVWIKLSRKDEDNLSFEKMGLNEFELLLNCDGMTKSMNGGMCGIRLHSMVNQTPERYLVNGIHHSNSYEFHRNSVNQTSP